MATMTPKEIALQFGTTPKNLRKFLRSDAKGKGLETPGKGSRWAIEAKSLKSMQKRFDLWNAAKGTTTPEAPKPTATRTKRTKPATAPEAPISTESDDAPETAIDA